MESIKHSEEDFDENNHWSVCGVERNTRLSNTTDDEERTEVQNKQADHQMLRQRQQVDRKTSLPSDNHGSDELFHVVVGDLEEDIIKKGYRIAKTETMPETVFSLVYVAPVNTLAFWLGIFVSLFQIAMPSLALLDLIVFSDDKNPLQVPNSVSLQVRIIGAMALVLAISQYWDFMEAVDKLGHGPPPKFPYTPAGATCW